MEALDGPVQAGSAINPGGQQLMPLVVLQPRQQPSQQELDVGKLAPHGQEDVGVNKVGGAC